MTQTDQKENQAMTATADNHNGHRIVKDRFAELSGVSRYAPGSFYCLDCHEPVAIEEEVEE